MKFIDTLFVDMYFYTSFGVFALHNFVWRFEFVRATPLAAADNQQFIHGQKKLQVWKQLSCKVSGFILLEQK